MVIGKKGAEVDKLRDELTQLSGKEVGINVEEIKRPELDAQLVADNVANQLAQRISVRRAMKRAVQSAMRIAALKASRSSVAAAGVDAEIARASKAIHEESRAILQHAPRRYRLHRHIDLARRRPPARSAWKVWIFKGEIKLKTVAARRIRRGPDRRCRVQSMSPSTERCSRAARPVACHAWQYGGGNGHYGLAGAWSQGGFPIGRSRRCQRVALTRHIKRGGKVWIRIFLDKPITKKPAETRMGKGKGSP